MTGRLTTFRCRLTAAFGLVLLSQPPMAVAMPACLQGINLSGAEFGEGVGTYGKDYIYPSEKTIDYFAGKGMNTIRLPFKWERLQPQLGERLAGDELQRLKDAVALIRARGMTVVLDPHNYAVYAGSQIGSREVPNYAFADFWARVAVEFAEDDTIVFGLMNEPHDISAAAWLEAVNEAIRSIRAVGAKNLVLVPGTSWTGAHSWQAEIEGGSNASIMLGVKDSGQNYAYELHQYLDSDYSGTHEACSNVDGAAQAIVNVSTWLRDNGKRGFLGEFGVAANAQCLSGLGKMLDAVSANGDVWLGWTYWVAGDWWAPTEPLNIQPTAEGDRKQLQPLLAAIGKTKSGDACQSP